MMNEESSAPKDSDTIETSDPGVDSLRRLDRSVDDVDEASPFLRQVLPWWGWDIVEKYELTASETPVEALTELLLLAAHLLERTSLLASSKQAVSAHTASRITLHEQMIADARMLLPFCPPLSEEVHLNAVDNQMVWLHDKTSQTIARLG